MEEEVPDIRTLPLGICIVENNSYFCNKKLRKECNLLELSVG